VDHHERHDEICEFPWTVRVERILRRGGRHRLPGKGIPGDRDLSYKMR
jgi:hypothetical protein